MKKKCTSSILNEQLIDIYEWLYCTKFSFQMHKTRDIRFASNYKKLTYINLFIDNVFIYKINVTKFLSLEIRLGLKKKKETNHRIYF